MGSCIHFHFALSHSNPPVSSGLQIRKVKQLQLGRAGSEGVRSSPAGSSPLPILSLVKVSFKER